MAETPLSELVVCSLEAWDEVWRRNQFFTDILLRRNPGLRVLFVEPPTDIAFDLAERRRPRSPNMRSRRRDRRLYTLRPLKPLPRRLGSASDRLLRRQVVFAAGRLGFTRPILWVNDLSYAELIRQSGWPAVYDITDDWLLAPAAEREIARLQGLDSLALADAREVVVCSAALAASRNESRSVTVVHNGVDAEHFRLPRDRPRDLPAALTAVYVGSLHEARLDVALITELAEAIPELEVVLVGPDSLDRALRQQLIGQHNIHLVGPRPYAEVPAYLQHADVVLVPHLVTPFTDSLDPIKAYECLAINTPTVATPVAGFRELKSEIVVVRRAEFVEAVRKTLADHPTRTALRDVPSWSERAQEFEAVLLRAAARC